MISQKTFLVGVALVLGFSGCTPFRAPPEEFETYFKPGINAQGVIKQMVACGYPYAGGFVGGAGRNVSLETRIRADQCMYRAGYKSRGGFRGICSVSDYKDNPACKE